MKKLNLISLCLFFSLSSHGAISVISDLDDTIKITNAGDPLEATVNGVFTLTAYTGMPTVINEMDTEEGKFYVLSASPAFLKPRVKELLAKNDLKADGIILRNVLRRESTLEFKTRSIRTILENSPDDFILLGDDVDKDPFVFEAIQKEFPSRITAAYIHVVKNREIPAGITRYYTAFDLALRESMAGRLNADSVLKVFGVVSTGKKLKEIIPKFADCPTSPSTWDWQLETQFSQESTELSTKLISFCQTRTPDTMKVVQE